MAVITRIGENPHSNLGLLGVESCHYLIEHSAYKARKEERCSQTAMLFPGFLLADRVN